mmetsp:Transcript_8483/g.18602  ORF Transcript_8483/g.18602 Transcript_8483/m.18602 type:complete len:1091 (+) Transcript_8483:303-3575(+)
MSLHTHSRTSPAVRPGQFVLRLTSRSRECRLSKTSSLPNALSSLLQGLLQLIELVLQLPHLLVRQRLLLLALLQLLLDVLDVLLLVLVAQANLPLHIDLVASGIVDVLDLLVAGRLLLLLRDGLTLNAQPALVHDPLLRRNAIAELLVVRDDQHTTLVVLDGQDQGTETIAVQVVRGLIQDQHMRVLPHRRSQHDLHLHASAQLVDLRVAGRLGVNTEVRKMLLNTRLREQLGLEASHRRLTLILALNQLLVAHLDQDLLLHPDVALDGLELPLHLVLEGLLLLLLPAVHRGLRSHGTSLVRLRLLRILRREDAAAHGAGHTVDAPLVPTGGLLVDGELIGLELDALLVVVTRKAPHDVLRRRLMHVLLEVVEGVLSHVRQAKASGLPDGARSGQLLTDQDLDGRGLSCAVRTNDRHAADLRHRQVHVHNRGLVLRGVLEVHARHAEDDLAAALHALKGTGLGEGELHRLVAQLEVRLLLRVLLHEHGKRLALDSLEGPQLPVLEIDDVRAHLVQEGSHVRGADNAAREGLEPVLEPLDVVHIQVTSGLIKHEHIAVHQLSRAQLHLHLPAAGVARHRQVQVRRAVRATRVSEASVLHDLLALLLRHLVLHHVDVVAGVLHPPPARLVHAQDREAVVLHANLLVLNLVLHENALQLVALREALELLVRNGTHQRGLTALVRPQQTVEPVALEMHLRITEQRERAVGQGEGALVQVHTLRVLLLDLLRRLRCHLHLHSDVLNHTGEGAHAQLGLPHVRIELPHVRRRRRKPSEVQANDVELLAAGLVAESALEDVQRILGIQPLVLRSIAITSSLLQRLVGLLRNATRLRVGDLVDRRLHQGLQPVHERQNLSRILHKLAHVVHNEAAGALHLLGLVVQPAEEHRQGDRKRRRLDILNEDASGKLLHTAMRLLDGLGSLHHGGQEGRQVLVASAVADGTHALHGRSLHLLLDVAGEVRNRRHQGHERVARGLRVLDREVLDHVQGRLLLRRLRLHAEATQESRHQEVNREGAAHLDHGPRGVGGCAGDLLVLVVGRIQDLHQGLDQEALRLAPLALRDRGKLLKGRLALALDRDLGHEVRDLALQRTGHGC